MFFCSFLDFFYSYRLELIVSSNYIYFIYRSVVYVKIIMELCDLEILVYYIWVLINVVYGSRV